MGAPGKSRIDVAITLGYSSLQSGFLEANEQIGHDSALAGNSILKSPKLEYAIIKIKARRKA